MVIYCLYTIYTQLYIYIIPHNALGKTHLKVDVWKTILNPFGARCNLAGDVVIRFREGGNRNLSHEKKTGPYYPLNPGCLIGILILVYDNHHITGLTYHGLL